MLGLDSYEITYDSTLTTPEDEMNRLLKDQTKFILKWEDKFGKLYK
jgi:hypothetical protein